MAGISEKEVQVVTLWRLTQMHDQPFNQIKTWSYFYSNWSGDITLEMDHKGHYYSKEIILVQNLEHSQTHIHKFTQIPTDIHMSPHLHPQIRSLFKCHLLRESFSDHPFQNRNTHTHTPLSPFPALFFSMELITTRYSILFIFTCLFIFCISHWNISPRRAGNFEFFSVLHPLCLEQYLVPNRLSITTGNSNG